MRETEPERVPYQPALRFCLSSSAVSDGIGSERWECLDQARDPAIRPALLGTMYVAKHVSSEGGLEPRADPTVYASTWARWMNNGLSFSSRKVELDERLCGGEWDAEMSLRLCKIWETLARSSDEFGISSWPKQWGSTRIRGSMSDDTACLRPCIFLHDKKAKPLSRAGTAKARYDGGLAIKRLMVYSWSSMVCVERWSFMKSNVR